MLRRSVRNPVWLILFGYVACLVLGQVSRLLPPVGMAPQEASWKPALDGREPEKYVQLPRPLSDTVMAAEPAKQPAKTKTADSQPGPSTKVEPVASSIQPEPVTPVPVEPKKCKLVLTVYGSETPLPLEVPPGFQVAFTVGNKQSVVGDGPDAVKYFIKPSEFGTWAKVLDNGKAREISTGPTSRKIYIKVIGAYENTVDYVEHTLTVKGADPLPPDDDPDKPKPPPAPPTPAPTDPDAKALFEAIKPTVTWDAQHKAEAAAMAANFRTVTISIVKAAALSPSSSEWDQYKDYRAPEFVVNKTMMLNRSAVKSREDWTKAFTAVKAFLDSKLPKEPKAGDYADLYPAVATALEALSK